MRRFRIRRHWDQPDAARSFSTAVSLHSHTLYSKEPFTFLPEFLQRSRLAARLARRAGGGPDDFSRMWWTPPLSPRRAWLLEKTQIEADLGLRAFVSLTDHDSIEAPLLLRILDELRDTPVSVEWTVPFADTFFHLGVHNLPGGGAEGIFAEMAEYTARPEEGLLRRVLERLHRNPEILVVFNHPMWDEKGIGGALHRQRVSEFMGRFGWSIHALEWNGFRRLEENALAVELAVAARIPIVSGGDRHGAEPNSAVNLTNARSFSEFIYEIRGRGMSEVLLMPQQREPRKLRMLRTVADVLRDNPDHGMRWTRWPDRIFCVCGDGQERSLSQVWGRTPPPLLLAGLASAVLLLDVARKPYSVSTVGLE